jgi:GTP-binding protein EngB required for normal cell division
MIVDSPGYGFTTAPVKIKNQYRQLVNGYLSHAVRLSLVLVMVNANTGLKGSDLEFLERLQHYNK